MDLPEHQIRRLVVAQIGRCNVCHRSYQEDDVEVLSRQRDAWMMLVQCEDCHARMIVAAPVNDRSTMSGIEGQLFAISQESAAPDSIRAEERQPEPNGSDPISADDLLEMHDFLETFDGNFRKLFSR